MKAVCQHDSENFRSRTTFNASCWARDDDGGCCPTWSLGHVTALLANKESCDDLTDDDVDNAKELLDNCVEYYEDGCLYGDQYCTNVPDDCYLYDAVYTILHYLTPSEFTKKVKEGSFDLQKVLVFPPLHYAREATIDFYESYMNGQSLVGESSNVVAIGGHFKFALFSKFLLSDAIYIGTGCIVVILIIWVYVGSFFVTIMTIVSMIMSMIVAYFLYFTIFRVPFFPFINVITAVLVIGVGADDCFVYVDLWKLTKKELGSGPEKLELVLRDTLKHAAMTMFVTSFTTASALFAGSVSSITAIRCFSIFAGSAIFINFFLTVTWIPAAVMIHEKYFQCGSEDGRSACKCGGCWHTAGGFYGKISKLGSKIFEEYLPFLINKLRIAWIIVLIGLGIGGFCVVFVAPRLSLPSQSEFQVFRTSHILEQYDQIYKEDFSFEMDSARVMPAILVWGLRPADNGNHWDPYSYGTTVMDDTFNVASQEAQEWLYNFCTDFRNSTLHDTTSTPQEEYCFIDSFRDVMESPCSGSPLGADASPCCNQSSFPYSSYLFKQCVALYQEIIICQEQNCFSSYYYQSTSYYGYGLGFNEEDDIVVLIIVLQTNTRESQDYNAMGIFWSDLNKWVDDRLQTAPEGLRNGWFISDGSMQMRFYDLQRGLATGTPISIGVSLAVAACVLLLSIRNILVTIYAMFTIACAVFVVIASVVLLGWELNIFESTVLSLAVGLSVDFTIHFGVAYRQATASDRKSRSAYAVRTLSAAITMAAFTTFIAGACMLPSTVLSYVQLGTYLMLVMAISWVYGVFLFTSLCCTIGPQGNFAQISRSCCHGDRNSNLGDLEMRAEDNAHEQNVDTTAERG